MRSLPVQKAVWLSGLITTGILSGCASNNADAPLHAAPTVATPIAPTKTVATTEPADPVIASVSGVDIHFQELEKPLLESDGLNMLMLIVQRDMARDACRQQGIVVSDEDLKNERKWTLDHMFSEADASEDHEKLLKQFLAQPKTHDQMSSEVEFEIVIETNAYLDKLVEPTLKGAITDDLLHQQFDETYGATVSVRDIVVANPQEAVAIRGQLDAGADFATLARRFSRDPRTGRLGGELPPFTVNSTSFPENFRRVAFSLKQGEVSDPVEANGTYHVLKLEHRNAPKAVKFEDVKDSLREDVHFELLLQAVNGVRARLAQQAIQQLKINNPILAADFEERLGNRNDMIRDREKIKAEMDKERNRPVPAPATLPATQPTTAAMTKPAPRPAMIAPQAANATKPVVIPPAPAATSRPAATTHP